MMPEEIVPKKDIAIAAAEIVVYLRRMAIRRAEIVRFHGRGYFDATRCWGPAGYAPTKAKAAA
jgi:hypothetical protein